MKCTKCDEDARAICKFCGRAVCKTHIQTALFTSGYSAKTGSWSFAENAVRVPDAVWCAECHPEHKGTS
jgi:hypothetical protein